MPAPSFESLANGPAGIIHQAHSLPDQSSLHLTISANQRNTWADFLELALPAAVSLASEEDHTLRESLPLDFTSYMVRTHVLRRAIDLCLTCAILGCI